ncbi:MAG: decarboxylating 6-phosphogluconate dehydrogenase [Chloroflexi bacterium]|nr:decarboxylating 6-phosphogluconate dehydrogenase [Chloroflexota bacterium]
MQLGMIGLGRMGGNMAQRLLQRGHQVVAYDASPAAVQASARQGTAGASSMADLVGLLAPPRAVWVMVPAGEPTEDTVQALGGLLAPDDVVIEGGNSFYKDSLRRAKALADKGIHFLDCGTSGGIWGLQEGYSLMIGGDRGAFQRLEPVFQALAPGPDRGYGYVGPAGAGHFVKMVHNAVEYGMMQAYAEGFELLAAKEEFQVDLQQVAELWRHGSVVRSWLLDLAAEVLKQDPGLESLEAFVEDSGEGRWAVQESVDLAVPAPVMAASLQARFRSRQERPFGARLLSALRQQFGGHEVRRRSG